MFSQTQIDQILLIFISLVPPKITLPSAIVRTLPGYKWAFPVTGTPPIYTALIRNSTVLVNRTYTASIRFSEEGNYTCKATSKYGTDVKEFVVIFNGKKTRIETQ